MAHPRTETTTTKSEKETQMRAGARFLSRGSKRAKIATLGLCLCALTALGVSAAGGEIVHEGNLVISIDGGITPTKLPKKTPAPITLKLKGSIKTADGSHPPALKTLSLQFDKSGHIYTKGLPTCTTNQLQSTLTAQARKVCGDALVGSGRVSAEIAFPEQPPFPASGPLLIFNGAPKGAKPVLIFHVHANVPAPTTFVTTAVISPAHGKYGTSTLVEIPTITGGQGSLTSFEATIHKTWTYKGQRKSLLLASCPTGQLIAHGEFAFADGSKLSGNVARPCTPTS
jgi:hypothetical protein